VQLGFSSNVPLRVTLSISGRLYFDSLVAKPLNNLYNDSWSYFEQSNDWQKVLLKTDLLTQRHGFYTEQNGIG
jgi:hypothetical protein